MGIQITETFHAIIDNEENWTFSARYLIDGVKGKRNQNKNEQIRAINHIRSLIVHDLLIRIKRDEEIIKEGENDE